MTELRGSARGVEWRESVHVPLWPKTTGRPVENHQKMRKSVRQVLLNTMKTDEISRHSLLVSKLHSF
jgi:hypothetical protein